MSVVVHRIADGQWRRLAADDENSTTQGFGLDAFGTDPFGSE